MFCTECGKRFEDTDRFCIGCGKPRQAPAAKDAGPTAEGGAVPVAGEDAYQDAVLIFQEAGGTAMSKFRGSSRRLCVVFTNMRKLGELLGVRTVELRAALTEYFITGMERGVDYVLLDASANSVAQPAGDSWQEHVKLLRSGIGLVAERTGKDPDSVFILGDGSVIPMPCLDNMLAHDPDLDSDYPYSSLSGADPWEDLGQPMVGVGRLPLGLGMGLDAALAYLRNSIKGLRLQDGSSSRFGLSAEVWQGASKSAFDHIDGHELLLSPPVAMESIGDHFTGDYDLLYFNLHGSERVADSGWFGESSVQFTQAIGPEQLSSLRTANVIGVEACYGARFGEGYSPGESCLVSALGARTLAFVGSSRIALGPSDPPIGLADVIIAVFLKEVSQGNPAGEALSLARGELLEEATYDIACRLTILEFNLFGDPEFRVTGKQPSAKSARPTPGSPDPKTAGRPESAAERLARRISGAQQGSRDRIGQYISCSIRPVDLSAAISAEIRRGQERCRELLGGYLAKSAPGLQQAQRHESCYSAGERKFLVSCFNKNPAGGDNTLVQIELIRQDLASGEILNHCVSK